MSVTQDRKVREIRFKYNMEATLLAPAMSDQQQKEYKIRFATMKPKQNLNR